MRFHFYVGNHGSHSQQTLRDILEPLAHTLRALGHDVTQSDWFANNTGHVNVIVEYFFPALVELLTQFRSMRWVCLATEFYDGLGFNHESTPEWRQRFYMFRRALTLPNCVGVWSLVPETAEFARSILDKPAANFDLGWVPEMENKIVDPRLEFDFGFVGTLHPLYTPGRIAYLKEIATLGSVVHCNRTDKEGRDAMLRLCRWSLGLKPHTALPYPSATRGPVSLWCGTPVLLEPVAKPTNTFAVLEAGALNGRLYISALGEYVHWSRSLRDEYLERQLANFKMSPMKPKVERLLDLTLLRPAGEPSPAGS